MFEPSGGEATRCVRRGVRSAARGPIVVVSELNDSLAICDPLEEAYDTVDAALAEEVVDVYDTAEPAYDTAEPAYDTVDLERVDDAREAIDEVVTSDTPVRIVEAGLALRWSSRDSDKGEELAGQ